MTNLTSRFRFAGGILSKKITVKSKGKGVVAVARATRKNVVVWDAANATGLPDWSASPDNKGRIIIRNETGKIGWILSEKAVNLLSAEETLRVWTERGGVVAEASTVTRGGFLQQVFGYACVLGAGVYVAFPFFDAAKPIPQTQMFGQLIAYGCIVGVVALGRLCSGLVDRILPLTAYNFISEPAKVGALVLGIRPSLEITGDEEERHFALILSLLRVAGFPRCRSLDVKFSGNPRI